MASLLYIDLVYMIACGLTSGVSVSVRLGVKA